jgi:hypothetical protein
MRFLQEDSLFIDEFEKSFLKSTIQGVGLSPIKGHSENIGPFASTKDDPLR